MVLMQYHVHLLFFFFLVDSAVKQIQMLDFKLTCHEGVTTERIVHSALPMSKPTGLIYGQTN